MMMLDKISARRLIDIMNRQFNGGLSKSIGKTARDIAFHASKLAEAENKMLKMLSAFPEYLDEHTEEDKRFHFHIVRNLTPTINLLLWHKAANRRLFRSKYLRELGNIDAPDWTNWQKIDTK